MESKAVRVLSPPAKRVVLKGMWIVFTAFRLYTVGPGWTRWAHILLWIGSNPIYGTVYVAQLVRVLGCDSRGRGFNSHHTPHICLGDGIGIHAGLRNQILRVRIPPKVQLPS